MRHFFAYVLTQFILFCTAAPPEAIPPDYLVTEITVTCPDLSPAPLRFTDQQNMGQVLQHLRSIPLLGQADTDSISATLPLYTIQLTHATGRVTEYHQLGTDYLSKNDSPWYHIAPEDGRFLIAFFPNSLYNE